MDIRFRYLPDSPPVFNTDRKVRAARWAAARADYLAGASAAEVCERHGLKLSTFRLHAKQGGWRRADQAAPFLGPDTPDPAPPAQPSQNEPLVIPDAPSGASRDATDAPTPPLTAAQMAAKAWTHVQAAIAAGRQIEARGWLRIHKELQPHVRAEEGAERRARMDREDAERRDRGEPEPEIDLTGPFPTRTLGALAAEIQALTRMAGEDDVGLQLDCFSRSESNDGAPGP
ncbi:hypothetical protein [Phenylobacterium sp.]|uniref:hypothetical protein n=1 Tax=Phenylobacterium sp. TaxID=1871053 RepID=UPI003001B3EF